MVWIQIWKNNYNFNQILKVEILTLLQKFQQISIIYFWDLILIQEGICNGFTFEYAIKIISIKKLELIYVTIENLVFCIVEVWNLISIQNMLKKQLELNGSNLDKIYLIKNWHKIKVFAKNILNFVKFRKINLINIIVYLLIIHFSLPQIKSTFHIVLHLLIAIWNNP